MTKEELIRRLRVLAEAEDAEAAHFDADELVLAYIGDREIQAAYDAIGKWYA